MHIKTKLAGALVLAALIIPGMSFAQVASTPSAPSIQAQIAALLAQIQALQSQLAAQGGSTGSAAGAPTAPTPTAPASSWCYTFTTNLSVGMTGSAVTALQTALQNDGESVTVNGTYDDRTAAAVTGFQQKYASVILMPYGLANGTGYAGRTTRIELNSLFGCSGATILPTSTSTLIRVCPAWGCGNPPIATGTISTPTTTPIIGCPVWGCGNPPITTGTISVKPKLPTACPLVMPYCPYGGHTVLGSNGCTQMVCNSAPVAPTVTISANPATINAGQSSTLTWSSTNATACSSGGVSPQTTNGVGVGWMGPTSTSQTVTVQPGTTMVYTVACTGPGGTSAPASVTVTVAQPASFVAQVQNLTATAGTSSVALSWSPVTASGVWGYNVYRSTTSGFTPSATNNGIASVVGGTSYTNTGLAAETYYYIVAAVDGNGNIVGAASAQVQAVVSPILGVPLTKQSPVQILTPSVNDNTLAPNTVSQTAVMLQSLQSMLNQLSALLKSL